MPAALPGRPVLFTGEMVFPWMFDDFACLVPYKEAANLLAVKTDWPALYRKGVLRENKVCLCLGVDGCCFCGLVVAPRMCCPSHHCQPPVSRHFALLPAPAVCCCCMCPLQVPLACATYLDDMYVDYNLAQDTLEGVAGVKQWVTNEFKHRWVMGEGRLEKHAHTADDSHRACVLLQRHP